MAFVDFLEVVCAASNRGGEEQHPKSRKLASEQLCNLADLIVYNVFLDQHFVDYQWSSPGSTLIDIEESFETELESIKLFVERCEIVYFYSSPNPNVISDFLMAYRV